MLWSPGPRVENSEFSIAAACKRLCSALLISDAAVSTAIVLMVLSHRAFLWWQYGGDIVLTIERHPSWLTWQFLPVQAYQDHFLAALLYLQQTPPIPHIILGLLIKLAGWPFGVAKSLIAVQAFISAISAALLKIILRRIGCNRLTGAFVALWFGLSSDVYLLKINEFGQLFYESGGMLLVTSLAALLCDGAQGREGRRSSFGAGVVAGLAALTRASLSFLFVPAAIVVVLRRGWRAAVLFMVPVLILQGGWCLKNTLVYRHLTIADSSWSGLNAANGINVMNGSGTMDSRNSVPLAYFILDHRDRYPDWLIRTVEKYGYVDWFTYGFPEFLPDRVNRIDARVQERMGGTNPFTNSAAIAELSRAYARVSLDYMLADPKRVWHKFIIAAGIFWQPMSDFGRLYMGPLYVEGPKRDLLTGPYLRRDGAMFARNSSQDGGKVERIDLLAPPLYAADSVSIIALFVFLPVLILFDLTMRAMRRTPWISGDLWALIAVVIYGVAVSTLVDLGENMRFRLSFEPVIIALTIGSLMVIGKKAVAVLSLCLSPRPSTWTPRV